MQHEYQKNSIRQIIDLIPRWMVESCAKQHKSDIGCSRYKTHDQFIALNYGQLNKCFTLDDISAAIGVTEIFIEDLVLV